MYLINRKIMSIDSMCYIKLFDECLDKMSQSFFFFLINALKLFHKVCYTMRSQETFDIVLTSIR